VDDEAPDRPDGSARPNLSRREMIQGALAVGGLGTLHWNRPLVQHVMGGVSPPSTCQCSGTMPPAPPLGPGGCCIDHFQAITVGKLGKCGGSMCHKVGRKCVNESKWTCVRGAWRRDTLKAVGCS